MPVDGLKKNALVIDDDAEFLSLMRDVLEELDVNVKTAKDGKEGLASFSEHPVDIVITDINMPDVQGNQVIRSLRDAAPTLPIIAVSGGGRTHNEEFLEIAAEQGADHVVAKPFDLDAFADIVHRALGGSSGRDGPDGG